MNNEYWLSAFACHSHSADEIVKMVTDAGMEHLVLSHGMEWHPYPQVWELSKKCYEKGIGLTVFLAGFGENNLDDFKKADPTINFYNWGTYWFFWGWRCLKNVGFCLEDKPRLKEPNSIQFLSMSGQPHLHRCYVIDQLAKRNMIGRGAVSWIRPGDPLSAGLPPEFTFEYFEERKINISDNFKLGDNSFKLPVEYDRASLIFMTESQWKVPFFTEKTTQACLRRKPFLCIGGPGQNHIFEKELGFLLMRDDIDYSFDLEPDVKKRVSGAVDQLEKWINNPDWHSLEFKYHDLLVHNHRRVYEVLKNRVGFPKIAIDMMERKDDRYPETRNLLMIDEAGYPD